MTSKWKYRNWKYRISVRAVILNLSYFLFPFVKPDSENDSNEIRQPVHYGIIVCDYSEEFCRLH
jgi:hypothetical protein